MRIKLFENFNDPGFIKIDLNVYQQELKDKNKENWTREEIMRVENISKKENCKIIFLKYRRIGDLLAVVRPIPDVNFTSLLIKICPLNQNTTPVCSIVIDKIEDEWYLVNVGSSYPDPDFRGFFQCDQFSGLEEFLKMIFKK